jgi:gamma-glutamylcyclotransferase (GGCT)/AIG2-like uncharacterized protein YtfP
MTRHILYVYGTLRPGKTPTFEVPGILYDLGHFPGIKLHPEIDERVVCEQIYVSNLASVDRYEGYNPDRPQHSLYIRKPYLDGWIYEFNQKVCADDKIVGGDWLKYKQHERGSANERFG